MSKEEENLNMELFSTDPVVDLPEGDSGIEFLFEDDSESLEDDGVQKEAQEQTADETVDDIQTDNDTNEDIDPESVVGEDTDDAEGEGTEKVEVDNSSSNPNLFNSLATLLYEKGLLSSAESDITSEEDFVNLFNSEVDTQVEHKLVEKIGKDAYESLIKGVPLAKIENDTQSMNNLEQIDEELLTENVELRHRVIFQDFINRGYSEDRATKMLQRVIDSEKDLEDSLDALESIKEFRKTQIDAENQQIIKQQEDAKKAEEKRLNDMKNHIKETNEVIKGFKITDAVKQKIEKNMFDVVDYNPQTGISENNLLKYRRENPQDFDFKLYYLFTITDGFKNFDSVVKNTKSTALQDLERAMRSNTKINDPGSPAYLQDPDSYSIDIAGHDIVVD